MKSRPMNKHSVLILLLAAALPTHAAETPAVAVHSVRGERLAFGKSIISYSLPLRRSRGCESHVSIVERGEPPLAQRFDRYIEVRTECETRGSQLRMAERPEIVLAHTGSD